jgi:DNA-binding beta-propeller fold protein YncE
MKQKIVAMIALGLSLLFPLVGLAKPLFQVTANDPLSLVLSGQQSKVVTFTVRNNSGVSLSGGLRYILNTTPSDAFQNNLYPFSTCGSSLANGASCTLTITVRGNQVGSGSITPQVCYRNNCSVGSSYLGRINIGVIAAKTQYAYITNAGSSTISICTVNADGSLTGCSAHSDLTLNGPYGMAINSTGTKLYVPNYSGNTLSICPVNADGSIGICTASNGNGTFARPNKAAINPAGTFLYVSNYAPNNNTIAICPIKADGTLGTCTTATDSTFNYPNGLALNPAGTILYVANDAPNLSQGTVSVCQVLSTGGIGSCTESTDSGFLYNNPLGLNSSGSFLYVASDQNNSLSVCPVNLDGSVGACTSYIQSTFSGPGGLSVNPAGTLMYVGNNTSINNIYTISICPLSNSNGSLGTCSVSNAGGTLSIPSAVVFN